MGRDLFSLIAVYQALPANRESAALRRVGWPVAGAFVCTGLWSVSVALRQIGFAQVMLLGIFACLLVAYLRLACSDASRRPQGRVREGRLMGRGRPVRVERSGGEGVDRKMQAVGLRRYGPPEVLEPLEVERPEPGPDGVLIRVAAAGVNPADCLLRSEGLRLVVRQKMPFMPAADVAGVVEAVGPDVTRFGVGNPVYAMLPSTAGGGYAGYAAAAEGSVAVTPPGLTSGLTFGEAAAVPLASLAALQALRDEGGFRQAFQRAPACSSTARPAGWGRSRSRSPGPWG